MQRIAVLTSYVVLISLIVIGSLQEGINAINVFLPVDFEQCAPATIALNNSQGNVSVLIHEDGVKKALVNVTLAQNSTTWNWSAVNVPAGDNFTIVVTDRIPKRKTSYSSQIMVDPSTTNNTSCLSARQIRGINHTVPDSSSNGSNDNDGSQTSNSQHSHKINTAEVSVIAGVLGGLLLALLSVILLMCWRRRRESRNNEQDQGASKDTILAHRIGVMGQRLDRHQVVTLFGEDGRAEGQAILGREGDAGWSYMSRIVPGLQTTPFSDSIDDSFTAQGRRGRRGGGGGAQKTKRYDNESKDGELPSYGVSEYEKKALPRYADDRRTLSTYNAAMILTTRHDSQGSRLTFQPDMLDNNDISITPRHSTRSPTRHSNVDNDEEVIVFRPESEQISTLAYERSEVDLASMYSETSLEPTIIQATSTAFEPSSRAAEIASHHRRSQSEMSLRRHQGGGEQLYR